MNLRHYVLLLICPLKNCMLPYSHILYLIIILNLSALTLLSLVGDPLSGYKWVWFTESHIICVISLLLVALLSQFILDN
jgi:hypothetical protein